MMFISQNCSHSGYGSKIGAGKVVSSMRKISVFVIVAVMAVSLVGCSQKADEPNVNEATVPPSSFSAGDSLETPGASEDTAPATEPRETAATAMPEQQPVTSGDSDDNSQGRPSDNQSSNNQSSGGQPQAPKQEPSAEQPKPEQPQAPTEQPKAEQAAAADPPKPKSAYDTPYDTAQIAADAKAYGESIGMTWDGALTKGNCSWEAPIQTSSVLSGERLKTAIQSGINRVKKLQQDNEYQPGEFHFRLYLESAGNGEYSLYFLMG